MNKNSSPTVLTISAHADDHVMMAGTLLKLRDQGHELHEALMTDSCEGRDVREPDRTDDLKQLREAEFIQATKTLGTKKVYSFHQADMQLTQSRNLVLGLVEIIRNIQPRVVLLHSANDWHRDHVEAYQIGVEAVKIAASGIQPELGQAWRVPVVLAAEGAQSIQAEVLVDITDYAEAKMKLWQVYASQSTKAESEYIEGLMRVRGYQLRNGESKLAEAFTTISTSPVELFK